MRKRGTRLDAFAKCLAAKQVKMYGAYWCPHCAEQKEMFESSFQYVPYVECGVPGSRDEAPVCKDAGIKHFPTWQFADGESREGTQPLPSLAPRPDAACHDGACYAVLGPAHSLSIAVLASCGAVVSSVSLYHHYGTSKTSYCDIGENFNCDIVNRSTYSTIGGIPVALIGIVGYLAVLALATLYRNHDETPAILSISALAGLGFALYLTYIEGFVLAAWCILCLSSLALISVIATLSTVLWGQSARRVD